MINISSTNKLKLLQALLFREILIYNFIFFMLKILPIEIIVCFYKCFKLLLNLNLIFIFRKNILNHY